jgi:hypothetical protein
MDVVEDLFAKLAAAGLELPHLGIILIGTGVSLVCIGAIFWRRASRSDPSDAPEDADERR